MKSLSENQHDAVASLGRPAANRADGNGRPATYASPAILERRRRILAETRNMISERGLSGFSMEELCKRADVAKRTIYNAFQSKELMIAAAIHEYFEGYVERIPFTGEPGTLQRNLERLIWIGKRDLQIRNYIRAVMAIYFSPEADPQIWNALHMMGVRANMKWVEELAHKKQLHPWVEPEQLVHDLVGVEYVTINHWSMGRIADEDFIRHLLLCYLTFVAGATRGAARREIEAKLRALHKGRLIERTTSAMRRAQSSNKRQRQPPA